MFIRINPDEENFNILKAINEYTDTVKNQLQIFNRQDFKKTQFNNNKGIKKSCQKSIIIVIKHGSKRKKKQDLLF